MPKAAKPKPRTPATSPKRAGNSADAAAQRRALFVEAFLSNGHNALEAAVAAGCPRATAARQGYRLRHDPRVADAIAARARHTAEAAEMTVDNWGRELRGIAFGSLADLYDADGNLIPPRDLPPRVLAALASVKVRTKVDADGVEVSTAEYKMWDKLGALTVMARHLGLFERDNSQRAENLTLVVRLV